MVNHKKIKHSVSLSRDPDLVQSMIALHLLIYKSDKEATKALTPRVPPGTQTVSIIHLDLGFYPPLPLCMSSGCC